MHAQVSRRLTACLAMPLPTGPQVVGEVLLPFLSAMSYLHARGIIHRDVKPENILLTAGRQLKLADFGMSIDWTEERPVTRTGTLDYMSPEVLACPEKSRPEENKASGRERAVPDSWRHAPLIRSHSTTPQPPRQPGCPQEKVLQSHRVGRRR